MNGPQPPHGQSPAAWVKTHKPQAAAAAAVAGLAAYFVVKHGKSSASSPASAGTDSVTPAGQSTFTDNEAGYNSLEDQIAALQSQISASSASSSGGPPATDPGPIIRDPIYRPGKPGGGSGPPPRGRKRKHPGTDKAPAHRHPVGPMKPAGPGAPTPKPKRPIAKRGGPARHVPPSSAPARKAPPVVHIGQGHLPKPAPRIPRPPAQKPTTAAKVSTAAKRTAKRRPK